MESKDKSRFNSLAWVKREIDRSLESARTTVLRYLDEPTQPARLREALPLIKDVLGTLEVADLAGAAMLAQEILALVDRLAKEEVRRPEDAAKLVVRALLQLPDYLEYLQSGRDDMPIVLVSIVNDLRTMRDEPLVSDELITISRLEHDGDVLDRQPTSGEELQAIAHLTRHVFQLGLLGWYRAKNVSANLKKMSLVCQRLRLASKYRSSKRLWWVAEAMLEALHSKSLQPSAAVKLLLGKLDRQIRLLFEVGEQRFAPTIPLDLVKNLLHYVATAQPGNPTVDAVRDAYFLGSDLPSAEAMSAARISVAGQTNELFRSVAKAVTEDVQDIKDYLEAVEGSSDRAANAGVFLLPALARLAETLGMLGLGELRQVVFAQHQALEPRLDRRQAPSEAQVAALAQVLLEVENAMASFGIVARDIMVAHELGAILPDRTQQVALGELEFVRVRAVAVRESLNELERCKHAIQQYLNADVQDAGALTPVSQWLINLSQTLISLEMQAPAGLLREVAPHLARIAELQLKAPDPAIERLADVVASVELYLESVETSASEHQPYLDAGAQAMQALAQRLAEAAPSSSGGESADFDDDDGFGDDQELPALLEADDALVAGTEILDLDEITGDEPDFPIEPELADFAEIDEDFGAPEAPAELEDDALEADLWDTSLMEALRLDDGVESEQEAPDEGVDREPQQPPGPLELAPEVYDEAGQGNEPAGGDEPAPASDPFAGLAVLASDEDPEILEVFVEELNEEIERLQLLYPSWVERPDDKQLLTSIRRAFHTLKGSSRLIGAQVIGEFAWAHETLLNRLLDEGMTTREPAVRYIGSGIELLPKLLTQFEHRRRPTSDIARHVMNGSAVEMLEAPPADVAKQSASVATEADEEPDTLSDWLELTTEESAPAQEMNFGLDDLWDRQPPFGGDGSERARGDQAAEELESQEGEPDRSEQDADAFDAALEAFAQTLDEVDNATQATVVPEVQASWEAESRQPPAVAEAHDGAEVSPASVSGYADATFDAEPPADEPETIEWVAVDEPSYQDTALIDIFAQEAEEHLQLVRDVLKRASNSELPVVEPLLRAVHTLNGAAHTAAVPQIFTPALEMERLLKVKRQHGLKLDGAEIDLLERFAATVGAALAALRTGEPTDAPLRLADEIHARLQALEQRGVSDLNLPMVEFDGVATPASDLSVADLVDQPPLFTAEAADFEAAPALADAFAPDLDFEAVRGLLETAAGAPDEAAQEVEPSYGGAPTVEDDVAPVIPDEPEAPAESSDAEKEASEQSVRPSIPHDDAMLGGAVSTFGETGDAMELLEDVGDADADADAWPAELSLEHSSELIDVYLEECGEILDSCDGIMARWQQNPANLAPLGELRRELHTLKGGARMAGLQDLGNVSHALENVLIDAVEGRLVADRELIMLINTSLDHIHQMAAQVRNHQPLADSQPLLAQLLQLRSGERAPARDRDESDELLRSVEPKTASPNLESDRREPSAVVNSELPVANDADVSGGGMRPASEATTLSELVKIRADLLDRMIDNVGEVNAFQARLEQQISGFSFNLQELDQTIKRLGGQLRRLEVETEAQIVHRYDSRIDPDDSAINEKFDPLELDRYSTMQQLARGLGESSNDLLSIHHLLVDQIRSLETVLRQQARISGDLQDGLMQTRMQQFKVMVPRLRRVVRRAALELRKEVDLVVTGEQQLLDRKMLEGIVVPLEHMLRNAVAHGIEAPDTRGALGKSSTGVIQIGIAREGPEVVITITDDGAGMDVAAIRRKGVEQGLLDPAEPTPDAEVVSLILRPGFTTAAKVSQLAGRGVGMDVVQNQVRRMNGVLDIHTEAGVGTRFRVHLPFTLAINQALLVTAGQDTFAVPLNLIEGVIQMSTKALNEQFDKTQPQVAYAGTDYRLCSLAAVLERRPEVAGVRFEHPQPVLLTRTRERAVGFVVDQLLGNREIVVKSVGALLTGVKGISGATILSDGRVILILDMASLMRGVSGEESWTAAPVKSTPAQEITRPTVMVVDDSITIRKVTARMLERHNYEVVTAKDGIDAMAQLQERRPDILLLDIEMPRMDGFELATHIRGNDELKDIPIVMITSRTGKKHRDRALELGIDQFLGKPYQDQILIETIQSMLTGGARQKHGSASH
ncbi:MAG: Hpt domain-containing protein [Thiotrichales bacterium]